VSTECQLRGLPDVTSPAVWHGFARSAAFQPTASAPLFDAFRALRT
jgi:hypothetical protein